MLIHGGRWVACNAFVEQSCATPRDARRRLDKLAKRGRRGTIGALPAEHVHENAGS
jgi:hypothetical protein